MTTATTELCYLIDIGSPLLTVNKDEYYKIILRSNTGYDFKIRKLVCFEDISRFDINSKVKVVVDGNKVKSIEAVEFNDCPSCKVPLSSLYEALNCSHGSNPFKTHVRSGAMVDSLELNNYEHGKGYKLGLSIENEMKYAVIFENSPLFTKMKNFDIGDNVHVEAWIIKGNLMKIYNLY